MARSGLRSLAASFREGVRKAEARRWRYHSLSLVGRPDQRLNHKLKLASMRKSRRPHGSADKRGIEPQVPVSDKSEGSDGTSSRAGFTYHQEGDAYLCSAGKQLRKYRRPMLCRATILTY